MTNELLVKMDEHRRDFITRLQDYIGYLQEELRINQLILASVEQSMSESRQTGPVDNQMIPVEVSPARTRLP
jgi:hypothetical protein